MNGDEGVRRKLWRTRPSHAVLLVFVAGVVLLTAACSSSTTMAQANRTSTSSPTQSDPSAGSSGSSGGSPPLRFAECMRSHGVTDYPDPDANGNFNFPDSSGSPNSDLNPNNPANQKAQDACQYVMGGADSHGTAAQEAQDAAKLLDYARCMRSHGIIKFPDPFRHPDGGYGFLFTGQVDQSSPAYLTANQACRNLLPGDHHDGRGA